jgi:NAD(P)-dependent dehydrogenase (short-subunit alcohol dehydrogenase family)|tara:strand:- start:82054 stop:82821 length:768 start_codon:yes stop_codon:yes gene_type:complete
MAMNLFDLAGRSVLVTGGSRGLGREMALGLAQAGAHVAIAGRNRDELDATVSDIEAAGGKCTAIKADLLDANGPKSLVANAVSALGWLDIVLHAAGHQVRKPLAELSIDEWDDIQAIHLRAAFLLAQGAIRHFRAKGMPGKIVFVGSLNSHIGIANVGAYAAAKSGLAGLARVLSAENAEAGICVNTIIPGYFHTALTNDLFADKARHDWVMSRIPMKRLGTPQDLVGAAIYFSSPASDYVTGAEIRVDGGWLAT